MSAQQLVYPISDSPIGSRLSFVALWMAIVLAHGVFYIWLFRLVGGAGADRTVAFIAGVTACVAWVVLIWATNPARGFAPILLGDRHVHLPRHRFARSRVTVSYREIRTVAAVRPILACRLIIDAEGIRPISYSPRWFGDRRSSEEFAKELRRRVESSSIDSGRLAAYRRRSVLAEVSASRGAWISYCVVALTALLFASQVARGTVLNIYDTMRMGSNAWWLLPDGGWYRLVTSNFLHFGPVHYPANLLAFLLVGPLIERLLGRWRYALVLLGSGLGAELATGLIGPRVSQGLSGMIYGLIGALLMLNVLKRADLPPPYRVIIPFVLAAAILTIVAEWLEPMIDSKAHLGGLITGGLLTLLVVPGQDLLRLGGQRPSGCLRVLALGLCLFYIVGFLKGAHQAVTIRTIDMVRSMAAVVSVPPFAPGLVEATALVLISSPEVTRVDALWVRTRMGEVLRGDRRNVEAARVLALAEDRLGSFEEGSLLPAQADFSAQPIHRR